MNRTLACLALLACPTLTAASGYEFEGLGTRQVARAGAATADADDWSVGYWNPASLPRSSGGKWELGGQAFGGYAYAHDSNSLSSLPGIGAIFRDQKQSSGYALGGIGLLVPIAENTAAGLTVYTPLLQGARFIDDSLGGTHVDFRSSAGIVVVSAAVGTQLTDTLAIGAGLGYLYGRIEVHTMVVNPPLIPGDSLNSDLTGDGYGVEGMLGMRWDPSPNWTGAFVYRSGADVAINGHATATSKFFAAERSDLDYTLRQPPTTDIGLAWRPNSAWTFTTDVHQTYWRRFTGAIAYDRPGLLLTNNPETLHWRDTWKFRFGLKRALSEKTDMFAGYSFDRYAVDEGSVDFATTVDAPMHRFSAGVSRWLTSSLQTSLGAIGGYGDRREGALRYRLSGFQLMGDARLRF